MEKEKLIEVIKNGKLAQLQEIVNLAKNDLFYLDKDILMYDKMEEFVHQGLCYFMESLFDSSPDKLAQLEDYEKKFGCQELYRKKYEENKDDDMKMFVNHYDVNDLGKKFRMVLMPRGGFKTSCVTIGFALQLILHDPNVRILIDSETFDKSRAWIAEIKGHLESNPRYRKIFHFLFGVYPDAKKNTDKWSDTEVNVAARNKRLAAPTISAAGIGTTKVGMHYDIIIADDLHSEKNVTTKEQIDSVVQHYKLLLSLLEPSGIMVVIGTRWDYNDVYQYIWDHERNRFCVYGKQAIKPDNSLFFPERLTKEFIENQKRSQGSYLFSCNPGEAPVLMADWTEKPITNIKVGDEVVGWSKGSGRDKGKLKPSKVLAIGNRLSVVVKITLASGRIIRCTPDHHWALNPSGNHKQYAPAKIGRDMMFIYRQEKPRHDNSWLAGIYDGEGSSCKQTIRIAQCRKHNPEVSAEIEKQLNRNGFEWGYSEGGMVYWINGGLQEKARFLHQVNPIRKERILKMLWQSDFFKDKDKVVNIEPDGVETVYSMQTETGNYIAWGYGSRNCQYQNSPVDDETATFKRSQMKRVSDSVIEDKPINWFLMIDPAISQEQIADDTAFVVAGFDQFKNIYVRNILIGKFMPSEIVDNTFRLYETYNPKAISIETVAFQKTLQYALNDRMKERGWWLPLKEVRKKSRISKEDRIRGLQPYYEFGRIFHLENCPFIDDLEYQLIHFPRSQHHDDIPDALADLLEIGYSVNPKERSRNTEENRRKKRKLLKILSEPINKITGY